MSSPTAQSQSDQSSPAPGRCKVPICILKDCQLPTHHNYRKPMTAQRTSAPPPKCRVPICYLEGCKLLSHRYYSKSKNQLSKSRSLLSLSSRTQDGTPDTHSSKSLGYCKPSRLRILSDRVEGLPVLPIQDAAFQQADVLSEITGLFNRFFCLHFDEITAIHHSPSSITYTLKQTALGLALKEPVYCTTVIALSQFFETKDRSPDEILKEPLTSLLYSRLLQYCRELLEDADESYVDLIVLAIVVVCLFDLSTGREESLQIHRRGLIALLPKIGGHHNLRLSLPYVLWIDRAIAIVLLEEPLFPSPIPPVGALNSTVDKLYGHEFEKSRLKPAINPDINVVCKDAARVMDLFEARRIQHDARLSSEPDKQSQVPSTDQIFFFRDHVDFRLSSLLSHRDELNLLESCILLATKIVEDTVAFADFLPALDLCLSNCIRERLSEAPNGGIDPNGKVTWGRFNDVLLWILFACAIPCTISGEHQSWVVKMISKVATSLFEKKILWQDTSKPSERKNSKMRTCCSADVWVVLSKFVWSPSLQSRFNEICCQIPE